MNSIISGTGSVLPKRRITNDYFLNHIFYKKDGTRNLKSGAEIVQKLEEISGIKERRFIEESEQSLDLLIEASKIAIQDSGIDKNSVESSSICKTISVPLSFLLVSSKVYSGLPSHSQRTAFEPF